ncbi:MAG: cell division protein FtsA [Patescibacteria group bacterium]
MPKNCLITGIDIGTSGIKILVAQKNSNADIETLAFLNKPALGIRKGVIINPQNVTTVLNEAWEQVYEMIGQKINSVYVNIGGSHISCISSRGKVAVSRADKEVSEEDIDRVLDNAKTFSISQNKEIIDVLATNFIVDEQSVKNAVGMKGVRLEADALMICVFSPYYNNLQQSISSSRFEEIKGIIPSPIAAARAVLSSSQKELGTALLNIGEGTTGLAVYEEGNLIHLAILPVGSLNITHDIAIGLRIDPDNAEKIKKEYGSCCLSKKEEKERIELLEPEPLTISRKELSKIIDARVSEIFEEANKELRKIGKAGSLPAGIILTGGGAKIPGILELAKKEFKLHCKIGKPKSFIGVDKDPSLSTICGLVLSGFDSEFEEKKNSWMSNFLSKLRILIP